MSKMRKILLALMVFFFLLAGAVTYFVLTFDANRYRGTILTQLSRAVNRPVEAAELDLQLVPLRLRLNQVRIPEDPGFAGQDFVRARSVQFEFSLWSFLRGQPQVLALELDQATIFMRSDESGQWNVATLAAPSEGERPSGAPVRNWALRDGTLVIESHGRQPLRLAGVEVVVSGLSATRPFPFEAALSFSPESRLGAVGRLGPFNPEQPLRTPVTAEISLEKFRPAALSTFVELPAAVTRLREVEGTLNLAATATETKLEGQLALPGGQQGAAVSLHFSAVAPAEWNQLELREATLEATDARINGSGSFDFTAEEPRFDLVLATSNADLDGLKSIPPRLGQPLPENIPPVSGKLTAALKLTGSPTEWQLTGTAAGGNLTLPLQQLSEPLRVPSLELTFEPDRLTTQPFRVSLPPGVSLNVTASVAAYRTQPLLRAEFSGEALPIEPLLSLLKSFGTGALREGWRLTGKTTTRVRVSGPLAEPAKLSYRGTLSFSNVSLAVPELSQPISSPAVDFSFDSTRLSAEPFSANIGQQLQVRVGFHLDNYNTDPVLSARMTTESASVEALLGLARSFGTDPLAGGHAQGQITTTIELSGHVGEHAPPLTLQGQATLLQASVQPGTLAEPIQVERAELEFAPKGFSLSNARLVVASTTVQGNLRVDDFEAPRVQFNFRGDTVDVEKLQAFLAPPANPRRSSAGLLPAVHAQEKQNDWFARVRGKGRLQFDQVRHGTLTLAPFTAPMTIAGKIMTCDPIEFGFYDGGARGRLVIDLRGSEPVSEFEGLLRGVDANKLLTANSESKDRLHGRLGGTLSVRFAGSERQRATQSATGKGRLSLVNGRLGHVNLSRELLTLGQLVGLSLERRDTPIEDMVTNFTIGDGWVRTDDLTLRTPDLTMTAVGGFSLQDELAFEATAVFTPEASRRLASRNPLGRLAGKVLDNVLNDEQGRTVIPFLIRGTFAQPRFLLDKRRLLERQLPRDRSPAESVLDVLERLRKKTQPPQ